MGAIDRTRAIGIATRLNGLRESVIREMTRLALKYDAINLAQGFPDFPPPPEVIAAAHQALDDGHNQYTITWGIPELRQAISRRMKEGYGLEYHPDEHISVTCGVTEAIVASLLGIADPGDEVIIIEPFHENYVPAVIFAGAKPVFVTIAAPRFELDAGTLRRAATSKTRAVIINSPHNPTGRVFTRSELEGVADLCREFNVVAITDEIYDNILYDRREHIPIASLEGMHERTITIGGLGKTFAVTGWRLGYVCAPEPFATALRTVRDFTTICAPAPLQYAAVAAFGLPESFYRKLREDYHLRRARMMAILEENRFRAQMPEGAYYVMADFEDWDFDGDAYGFARFMAEEVGVAVVPGSSFYSTPNLGKNQVRFAFAKKPETFNAVEDRFRRWRQKK